VTEYPEKRVGIHITDSSQFRGCRLKWHWSSNLRMGLEAIAPPRALWMGTGMHHALERYYGYQEDPVQAFSEWAEQSTHEIMAKWPEADPDRYSEFNQDILLMQGMLQHYQFWTKDLDTDWEVVSVEQAFCLKDFIPPREAWLMPVGGGQEVIVQAGRPNAHPVMLHIDLEGRGDMVVKRKSTDEYWVVEHKSAAQMRFDRLILEEQPGIYQWAMAKELGVEIQGVIFNFLRKKVPAIPEQLKAGGLTQRSNIDTTYDVYLATIQGSGLNPKDYQDTLDRLKEKGNKFFHREDVVRADKEQDLLMQRMRYVAEDMVHPNLAIYPKPDIMGCAMCSFNGPCIALADGSDWKFILESKFQHRKFISDVTVLEEPPF
jgi:hypothetical protein